MKLILITFISLAVGIMVACGGGGGGGLQFENAQDVVDSFDEFDFRYCEGGYLDYMWVGATSVLRCSVLQSEQGKVDVYTYDGDAETLCKKVEFCKQGRSRSVTSVGGKEFGGIMVFTENVMLVTYDDLDFADALIEDLQQ